MVFIIDFTATLWIINAAKMTVASVGVFYSCHKDFTAINTAKITVAEF